MNYDKWASFDDDTDDDDDRPRKPRVTRLDGPSQVTLGADTPSSQLPAGVEHRYTSGAGGVQGKSSKGPASSFDYSRWDNLLIDSDDDEDDECGHEDELDKNEQHQLRRVMAKPEIVAELSRDTDAFPAAASVAARHETLLAHLTRNGAHREGYLWRQTETEVELSVVLPAGTKARQLQLGLQPTDSSHPKQRLLVHWRQARWQPCYMYGRLCSGSIVDSLVWQGAGILWEASLAYPVEDPEEDEQLAWEVTDFENQAAERLLRVSLHKKGVQGIVIWWSRACVGEEVARSTHRYRRTLLQPHPSIPSSPPSD